jgi:hypothetical protein
MRTSDRAWVVLAAAIVTYEVVAQPEELMSEAVDRYLESRPWLTRLAVVVVSAHLLNAIPLRFDPLHQLAARLNK